MAMRVSIPVVMTAMILILGMMVGCATEPEPQPEAPAPEVETPAPEAEAPREEAPAEEAAVEAEPEKAPEPEGPTVAFVGPDGEHFPDGAGVTLPTGAPPEGQISLFSSDPEANGYLTRDGSIPTPDNHWIGGISIEESGPLSSTVEVARIYRFMVISGNTRSSVVTVRVNWQHEELPSLPAPDFVVSGDPVGGSVTLPVGGSEDPAGRLYIRSNYLGATIYVTNDGSKPTPQNYWRSGLSDGFYVFATDEFSTTYNAVAILRESTSEVNSLSVTWSTPE